MLRFKNISYCIYSIKNTLDDRIYIGSTKKLNYRINQHTHHLKKGTHHSGKLQRFVNKYGIDKIYFELVSFCGEHNLIETEQKYIDLLRPEFNIRQVAEKNTGIKHSEETKRKIVETRRKNGSYKSYKHTKETIEKMSGINHWNYGNKLSDEVKNKIRETSKFRITSEETKVKISKALKGKIVSEDTKDKLRQQKIGVKNPMYGKSGDKHHNYGKKVSEATIIKMKNRAKMVIDLKTGFIFNSYIEASEFAGVATSTMGKYLCGLSKSKTGEFKYYETTR